MTICLFKDNFLIKVNLQTKISQKLYLLHYKYWESVKENKELCQNCEELSHNCHRIVSELSNESGQWVNNCLNENSVTVYIYIDFTLLNVFKLEKEF